MGPWEGNGHQFDTGYDTDVRTHAHPTSEFAGSVGDLAGPAEGPAFQVVNYLIKY